MSVSVTWTCNWCGAQTHSENVTDRPAGWMKLICKGPVWGDLCGKCVAGPAKYPVTKHGKTWIERETEVPPRKRLKMAQAEHDVWIAINRETKIERLKRMTKSLGIATPSDDWMRSVLVLALVVTTLTLKCRADTIGQVTNILSLPWSLTNAPTFYRLVKVPPIPDTTNQVSEANLGDGTLALTNISHAPLYGVRLMSPDPVTIGQGVTNASVVAIVPVDQIASIVITTNWSDHPPAGVAPLVTTLADSTRGLEYGTIITNKIIQVLENGIVRPVVVSSYTNTVDVLTRQYQFKRVHDPASVQRLRKHPLNVR